MVANFSEQQEVELETMDMETILDLTPSTDEILDLRKPKSSPKVDETMTQDLDKMSSSPIPFYTDRTPLYYTSVSPTSPHLHPAVRDSPHNLYTPNILPPDLVTSTYPPVTHNIITPVRCEKPTRPFKAYPSDPLPFVVSSSTPDVMLGLDSNEEFLEFRRRMLSKIQPPPVKQNKNMNRSTSPNISTSTQINEDDPKRVAYLEKRRKNNEAAKRSRDARRAKEDEIAIRAAFLEQENLRLKYELATLKDETEKLRTLVYNRHK